MVGKGLGDCLVVTATADGTNQSFIDDDNLDGPNGAYKGFDIYFTGGTADNLELRRRIADSTQAVGRVTWNKVLPAETAEGDEAELWNLRGIGIKAIEVNEALNWALALAGKQADIPIVAVVSGAFSRDSPRVSIPTEVTRGMYGMSWEDGEGVVRTIDRASDPYDEGWYYDQASRTIVIGGSYLSPMDGMTLTINGLGTPPSLLTDDDTTTLDPEWLVAEATKRVISAIRVRNPEAQSWLPPAWQESQQKRPYASGRGIANAVMFK
jgi:hypothetical protein